jgi:hypothetical protein
MLKPKSLINKCIMPPELDTELANFKKLAGMNLSSPVQLEQRVFDEIIRRALDNLSISPQAGGIVKISDNYLILVHSK